MKLEIGNIYDELKAFLQVRPSTKEEVQKARSLFESFVKAVENEVKDKWLAVKSSRYMPPQERKATFQIARCLPSRDPKRGLAVRFEADDGKYAVAVLVEQVNAWLAMPMPSAIAVEGDGGWMSMMVIYPEKPNYEL